MTDVNSFLSLIGAILAFCAVDRMDRTTAHAVRAAIVLVGVALLGQSLTAWFEGWEPQVDALLYGGMIAYFLACRRINLMIPLGFGPEQSQRLSILVSIATFIYFFIGLATGQS